GLPGLRAADRVRHAALPWDRAGAGPQPGGLPPDDAGERVVLDGSCGHLDLDRPAPLGESPLQVRRNSPNVTLTTKNFFDIVPVRMKTNASSTLGASPPVLLRRSIMRTEAQRPPRSRIPVPRRGRRLVIRIAAFVLASTGAAVPSMVS